jgi:hypothetical protein
VVLMVATLRETGSASPNRKRPRFATLIA